MLNNQILATWIENLKTHLKTLWEQRPWILWKLFLLEMFWICKILWCGNDWYLEFYIHAVEFHSHEELKTAGVLNLPIGQDKQLPSSCAKMFGKQPLCWESFQVHSTVLQINYFCLIRKTPIFFMPHKTISNKPFFNQGSRVQ